MLEQDDIMAELRWVEYILLKDMGKYYEKIYVLGAI